MTVVWYVLIHVSLGLIGSQHFTVTNLGALYCALAGLVVQGYAVWQIHLVARQRFEVGLAPDTDAQAAAAARRGYWSRLLRVLIFRVSAFSVLTLLIAALVRGAGG